MNTGDTLRYPRNYIFRYLQVFTTLHEVLDIINDGKVQAKNLKEVHLLLRQVSVGQNLDQVSKVIATTKHIHTNTRTTFNWVSFFIENIERELVTFHLPRHKDN